MMAHKPQHLEAQKLTKITLKEFENLFSIRKLVLVFLLIITHHLLIGQAVLVKNINPSGSSQPLRFVTVNGILYFTAYTPTSGEELWRSDGTDVGTYMVKDLCSINSSCSGFYSTLQPELISIGNTLYFTASANGSSTLSLWKSDGTDAGTVQILTSLGGFRYLANFNGKLVFSGHGSGSADRGSELYITDGTDAGTTLININNTGTNGLGSSNPIKFTVSGTTLFFAADDGIHGSELWKSDGVTASLVKDINVGTYPTHSMLDSFLKDVNGKLFFSAFTSALKRELYVSDGTAAGTTLVKDINSLANGYGVSPYQHVTSVGNNLVFLADDGTTGWELWTSDGTTVGTFLLKDINPGTKSGVDSEPHFINQNGQVLFTGYDALDVYGFPAGGKLWKTNGTVNGTVVVSPDVLINYGRPHADLGAYVVFYGENSSRGNRGLWKTDGTSLGTSFIQSFEYIIPTEPYKGGISMIKVGNKIFIGGYQTTNLSDQELWKLDAKSDQTITFPSIPTKALGTAPFTLSASASSGLPVSYSSSNTAVATVSGNTITVIGAGTTDIIASQAGNANYNAATNVTQVLTVSSNTKQNQTITFPTVATKSIGGAPFSLTATASSGLPVSYTSSNTAVATISGNTVTIVGAGSTIITASQTGDVTYNAAPSIQQTLTVTTSTPTTTAFNYTKQILGTVASTLTVSLQSKNTGTGAVAVNGGDSQAPSTPFTFIWGDNTNSSGFFPSNHTYSNVGKNYIVKVIANYSSVNKDTAELLVDFITPTVTPITLDPKTKVIIPSTTFNFSGTRLYTPPSLTSFPDNLFTQYPRATVEYILSVASAIGYDMVNANTYLYNSKFEQYMLRDATYGGAYSIWYTNPVGFGVGDVFINGDVDFSSLTHEMGHNYTLNTPANFYYGGSIDGNANAIYSEAMAQIFAHAAGYEMINQSQTYGIGDDMRFKLMQKFIASAKYVRLRYDQYVTNGKVFKSWNDPATNTDETFDTFMTIAYKFMQHAENGVEGYKVPFQRMMTTLQKFNANYKTLYDQQNNNAQADAFRSTLMVAAVSSAFNADLRSEFIALNFPINNTIFEELIGTTTKQNQIIAFPSFPAKIFTDVPFNLGATASSGLTVSYASSNLAVATISGNTVTIVSPGTSIITASQNGNASFNPAANVSQTLTVDKANQTITFGALPSKAIGSSPFALTATGGASALPITFTSSNASVATVSGNIVTIIGAGTTIITASQAGNANYYAAANVTQTLVVSTKQNQTITFATIIDKTLGGAPFALTATASSALLVSYATTSDKITISSSQVTLVKAGRATITASQAGDAIFNAATSVDQSFCIKPAKPTITVSGANTEAITLTSSASAGNQWFKDGTAISGATNTTLSVTTVGVYKLQIKVDDCVSEFSADTPFIITGDISAQSNGITIYPNPVEDYLEVRGLKDVISNSQLIDMTGRTNSIELEKRDALPTARLPDGQGQTGIHRANVQHLSAGVYLLRVQEGKMIHQIKFIKK